MSLNCSITVLVGLVSFMLIQTAFAMDPPTTAASVNASGPSGKDGRDRGDGDEDDGGNDGRGGKPISIDTYNAFNFYGQDRAAELIRRMLRRLEARNDLGDEEDLDDEIEEEDEKDKERKYLTRTNYREFPDEALDLPKAELRKFEYGEFPSPTSSRRRPRPRANPVQGPAFPVTSWGGGQGGGFPVAPLSPIGSLLLGWLAGAGTGFQAPNDYYEDDDGKKGKKKKRKGRKGGDDDDDDDDDDDEPLDWTNLCIYECGEGVPNGYHRKCDDCSKYFMCVNGQGTVKDCGNLKFNHLTDQCDHASQVDCRQVEFAGFPKTTSPSSMTSPESETSPPPRPLLERMEEEGPFCVKNCYGVPDGTYPSCHSCRKFVKCWWGNAWALSCHRDEFFDPEYEVCRPEDQVDCREEEVGGENKGGDDKGKPETTTHTY